MYISLADSSTKGFKKWSDAHPPHSNDDDGDVARDDAIAVADPGTDRGVMPPLERLQGPWLVPGVGNAL